MAAQTVRIVAREAVLEQLPHQGLGVRQGHYAVADVAHGRDGQRLPQPARGTAVVGHGHHGRDVAAVLLQAPQQRRKPGPAAQGHDPRATGQEAPLEDDVGQRPLALGWDERRDQGVDDLPGAEGEQGHACRAHDQCPHAVRQELQGQGGDHGLAGPADLDVAIDLAQPQGPGQGQAQLTGEDQQQPALDPHAGPQPAPQACCRSAHVGDSHSRSSSRWNTATGPSPRSSSQPRNSSAMTMDRW